MVPQRAGHGDPGPGAGRAGHVAGHPLERSAPHGLRARAGLLHGHPPDPGHGGGPAPLRPGAAGRAGLHAGSGHHGRHAARHALRRPHLGPGPMPAATLSTASPSSATGPRSRPSPCRACPLCTPAEAVAAITADTADAALVCGTGLRRNADACAPLESLPAVTCLPACIHASTGALCLLARHGDYAPRTSSRCMCAPAMPWTICPIWPAARAGTAMPPPPSWNVCCIWPRTARSDV